MDRKPAVVLAGASGTIGCAVAVQLLAEGFPVTALLRETPSGRTASGSRELEGADIRWVDFADGAMLSQVLSELRADIVISCLASRSGAPRDAQRVDHDANLALLEAAEASDARQFILLSAICVQRPRLAFQHAKLAFEARLRESPVAHTIVRPTAFFKSLSGQVGRVAAGKPFLLFGDGTLTRCKPISDADCARFIAWCIDNPTSLGGTLPIGGPGPAITLREQGELLFERARQRPRFRSVPPSLFMVVARLLAPFARVSKRAAAASEYARIGHYYATQSMLLLDPATGEYSAELTPEYGSDRLGEHYDALLERTAAPFTRID